ncbi:MAG TPA: ABC transporter permease [Candidatus Paceibacterota bacterium]|jgi:ABC-2 type transport system permease protein|nr:ABC transporter permease [Candidatus Paceibacterota bacterium]
MNKTIRDIFIIGKRELLIQVRNPLWLFFGLFQPIVYLALFSPFLKGIASTPGFPQSSAIQFFAPGMLIMNVLFGAAFAGFGLIDQLRSGFIERIRVTPVKRASIALGFVLRTPVVLIIQSAILLVVAVLFFHLRVDIGGVLLLLPLLIIIGITMASLSYTIALTVKDEGTLAAITNFFTLPLFLLAGVMLPISFAPKVIQSIAHFDPFTYAVDASRALVNGAVGDHSVPVVFIIFAVLGVVTVLWFITSMREAVA